MPDGAIARDLAMRSALQSCVGPKDFPSGQERVDMANPRSAAARVVASVWYALAASVLFRGGVLESAVERGADASPESPRAP